MAAVGKTPMASDVDKAKVAIRWDDEVPDRHCRLFPPDNDPNYFRGTSDQLREIREAMKRYENQEAGVMEDKAFYDARFRLQFMEVQEE